MTTGPTPNREAADNERDDAEVIEASIDAVLDKVSSVLEPS